MRSIRNDILAVCVALIALVSQMFFGVVHSTTIWMASAGPVAQVEAGSTAHNFLQICSAGGLVSLDDEGKGSGQFDPSACPVCSSAAAAPMLEGSEPPLLSIAQKCISLDFEQHDQVHIRSLVQLRFARGPPAFS